MEPLSPRVPRPSSPDARRADGTGRLTVIFSRRPAPGRAKTRLTPPLAPAQAAELAEAMLRDIVERHVAAVGCATRLCFTPAAEEAWFRSAFPDVALAPQRGEDLGARLADAFARGLADQGVASMVVIGSDQPTLGAARVAEAHAALAAGADLVLAPDPGGGYALCGLRAPHPELFTEVEMSSAGMCAATVRLARARGLVVRLLPETLDVDEAADLVRLGEELAQLERRAVTAPEFPRHTAAFLGRHAARLP